MKTNLLKAVANALIQQGSGDHARRLSPPSKILEKLSQSPETQSLTTLLKRRIEQHSFLSLNDKELIAWSKNGKYNYFLLDNLRSRRIMSDYNICSLYLGPLIRANLIPPSASTEVLDFAFACNKQKHRDYMLKVISDAKLVNKAEIQRRHDFCDGTRSLESLRASSPPLIKLTNQSESIDPLSILSPKGFDQLPLATQTFAASRALESSFWQIALGTAKKNLGKEELNKIIFSNACGAIACFGFLDRNYTLPPQTLYAKQPHLPHSIVSTGFSLHLYRLKEQLKENCVLILISHRASDGLIERILDENKIEYVIFANGSCINHNLASAKGIICSHLLPAKQSLSMVRKAARKKKAILVFADQFSTGTTISKKTSTNIDFHISDYSLRLAKWLKCPLWFGLSTWNCEAGTFKVDFTPAMNLRDSRKFLIEYVIAMKKHYLKL